jgi:cyclic-di-GMP-binding protein
MPSFDVVSEVDKHALTNAVDQASKIIVSRYDFKGVDAKFDRKEYEITMTADNEYQLDAMLDSLRSALHKNGIGVSCLDVKPVKTAGKQVKKDIVVRTGVESELAKKIVKMIKDEKMKVQASIQGDQVRVTGKKRDDLQECMAMLRAADIEIPLQYTNFRD